MILILIFFLITNDPVSNASHVIQIFEMAAFVYSRICFPSFTMTEHCRSRFRPSHLPLFR